MSADPTFVKPSPGTETAPPEPYRVQYVVESGTEIWSRGVKILNLVRHLTRRHLLTRYRGSVFGFFWSLLNPILMMCVYTFVFRFILRLSAPGVPFPVFFLTGILAWSFFNTAVMNAAVSVLDNAPLIQKTYFPRAALPWSTILSNLANYLAAIPVLLVFNIFFGVVPSERLLLLPLTLLLLFVLAAGLGLILAAITPFFRDMVQLMDVLMAAWFFATPIIYPMEYVRENLGPTFFAVYQLNPLVGAIALARTTFIGAPLPGRTVAVSAVGAIALLVVGTLLYRRLENRFIEVL
jgi:ABC-type polysaccharide/polyol phosphate export permease